MDTEPSNKVAVVTGGASGIGRAVAEAFAAAGTCVVIADLAEEAGQETARALTEQTGTRALFCRTDVTDSRAVQALIEQAMAAFGRLDVGVNSAGITGPAARAADVDEQDWDAVIRINLKGPWLCMKYEIAAMLQSGGGAIVNIASTAGLRGGRRTAPYTASKHGVVGLTKSAAQDYARSGIRINAVCPGSTETPMLERIIGNNEMLAARLKTGTAMGRAAEPREIASTVLWLCSDAASFVTGQAIAVDGGGG